MNFQLIFCGYNSQNRILPYRMFLTVPEPTFYWLQMIFLSRYSSCRRKRLQNSLLVLLRSLWGVFFGSIHQGWSTLGDIYINLVRLTCMNKRLRSMHCMYWEKHTLTLILPEIKYCSDKRTMRTPRYILSAGRWR